MPLTFRQRFVELVLQKRDSVVLMGGNGPDVFDCSGLGYWALKTLGSTLADHSAQMFADETPNLVTLKGSLPLPGDFCVYGYSVTQIVHIAYWMSGGGCVSADGATKHITELEVAKAKPSCRVRSHPRWDFRADLPYSALHRNTFADDLDRVTR